MKKCQHAVRCLTFFILSILLRIGDVLLFYFIRSISHGFYFIVVFYLNKLH